MLIQYLLPTITISIAYYQIFGQLRIRMQQKLGQLAANPSSSSTGGGGLGGTVKGTHVIVERIENDILRMKRTSNLLIWVGLMFCVCWLPLNILNTVRVSSVGTIRRTEPTTVSFFSEIAE